jgi:hypothetical protein
VLAGSRLTDSTLGRSLTHAAGIRYLFENKETSGWHWSIITLVKLIVMSQLIFVA